MPQNLTRVERIGTGPDRVLKIDSKGAIQIPVGNSFERPDDAKVGMIRYNDEVDRLEHYTHDSQWVTFMRRNGDTLRSIVVEDRLEINGLTFLNGNTQLDGSLTMSGQIQTDQEIISRMALETRGYLEVDGESTLHGGLLVEGRMNVKLPSRLYDELRIDGQTFIHNHLIVHETLDVHDNITTESNLFVKLNADIDGTLDVGNDALFQRNVSVAGSINLSETLTVGGQTTLNGEIYVNQMSHFNASVAFNSLVTHNVDVVSERDVEIKGSLRTWLDSEFEKDVTVQGSMTVNGNMTVNGTLNYVNSEITEIKDPILELNRGEPNFGVTSGISGIEIDRGVAPNTRWIWDENNKFWGPEGTKVIGNIDTIYVLNMENVLTIDAIGSLRLPMGEDSERPEIIPVNEMQGMIRFNTDQNRFEGYNGTEWERISQIRNHRVQVSLGSQQFYDIPMSIFGVNPPEPFDCTIQVRQLYSGVDPDLSGMWVDANDIIIANDSNKFRVKNLTTQTFFVEIVVVARQ